MWITFIKPISGRDFHHLVKQLQVLHGWKNMGPWTLFDLFPPIPRNSLYQTENLDIISLLFLATTFLKITICSTLLFSTLDFPRPLLHVFRECNFFKLIWQEISSVEGYHIASWKMYNFTRKSCTKERVREHLDCKV